ncbi:sensor histidine kinase [Arcobacter cloacae]|uniref:histidine kinase n=1 Tax=Arcobacter cloacae TaxID=1054034 RepID=A0A6M8NL43_9BACT|nr:cache domain-containing protein [Arcobacter cloacae]QKF89910.1 Cache sensor-containing two-component system histidine kinase [Arcobacter cloacae]RXI39892.1 histidine kinase [Arcobacter cloacae]
MLFENEKKFLNIMKYTPSIFVLSITIFILTISFLDNKKTFEEDKEKIRFEYTKENEEIIKQRVYEVYNYIKREQEYTEQELRKTLKEAIDIANNIIKGIYNNNLDKSEEEIKKLVVDALRNIKFNDGRGYYFIYENSGKNILLPHNEKLEGKNFWNHQDAKGAYIIQDMTRLLSTQNEAFYEWYWYNPKNPDIQRKKIGLVKNLEQFDWFIGTGEYVEEFEKEVQERVLRNIKEVKFGSNGYFFIINYDSIYLSHIKKEYIGQNAIKNNDTVEVKKVIEDMINIAKNGEGFYSYIQNKKPDNNESIRKISFVKGLDNWSWMIGTGFYEDDMQKAINNKKNELDQEFNEYLFKTTIFAFLLIFLLLSISIYFSKKLQEIFRSYQLEKTRQQNIIAQKSKMAAMGEMIGHIAHQWRQPLSSISTSATGMKLQKELNILEDKNLIDGLEQINKSVQYLSQTIDDFRNFYKPNKNKTEFYVLDTVDKVINLTNSQFSSNGIKIIKSGENIKINTYENELIQVIINLLNNARDELLKKDFEDEKLIFINVYKKNKKLFLEIKDNARGVSTQIIDKIFEAYFTTKNDVEGTGIGLYMSNEIITKSMKGKISVSNIEFEYESKKYIGAKFSIILPLINH